MDPPRCVRSSARLAALRHSERVIPSGVGVRKKFIGDSVQASCTSDPARVASGCGTLARFACPVSQGCMPGRSWQGSLQHNYRLTSKNSGGMTNERCQCLSPTHSWHAEPYVNVLDQFRAPRLC
ncbi:hypothetical protein EXIGLDRAFT_133466 [Exidia glandulosa HHB12029]|uniref:Uncharacterized protein n=1 Tax=Exidia glandulosa HHB12029 TaxID=1314781 RepID=A0A165NFF6_EXIGL|nr:hypothetical protein EXIGLDRAFT_133466 [Exidia glandulosa HHB12029]